MITISVLKTASQETLADLNDLVAELRGETKSRGMLAQLKHMVRDPGTAIIIARDGKRIVGMAVLFSIQKVGKRIGYVEDVVVARAYRGRSLGKRLMLAVEAAGRKRKCSYLYLTSRPARIAANALYRKLGFDLVKTNPYRLKL